MPAPMITSSAWSRMTSTPSFIARSASKVPRYGRCGLAQEPWQPVHGDFMPRVAALGQVRHDFAHDTAKLEAVARARRSDTHLQIIGMPIEDEVLVARVGEHASAQGHRRAGGIREIALGEGAQHLLVAGITFAV